MARLSRLSQPDPAPTPDVRSAGRFGAQPVRFRLKSPTHLRAIEVEDWLRADHEGPFTFESICDELKVDVEFLRRLALSGDRMQVPRRSCNGRNHTVPINLLRRAYGNGK